MGRIAVRKSVHIEQPSILVEALVQALSYVSETANTLMEHVTRGLQRRTWYTTNKVVDPPWDPPPGVIRRSDDNGRSWREVEQWSSYRPRSGPTGKEEYFFYSPNQFPNPRTGEIVRVYARVENIRGLFPWDKGSPWFQSGLLFSQSSRDGLRWSEPKQVICRGHDPVDWAPGIRYGRNAGAVEGVSPLRLGADTFILPFFSQRAEGETHKWSSAGLVGRWTGEGDAIEWELTSHCTVGPHGSRTGGDEPSFALLPDGRLLMTMRVRTDPGCGATVRSAKYYTTSRDLGRSWAEPEVLRYDDGEQVLCPASLAHLVRSSVTGKLYIITNILDEPTWGCRPRFTLQIAEIDEQTLRLRRDSVTVIDRNDPSGPPTIDFSNWRWYEDRETRDIVLVMTGCPGDKGRSETCGVPPHSYRYDITPG